jgi:hypothetical protein
LADLAECEVREKLRQLLCQKDPFE